jgi:hypothetical protein
MEKFIFFYSPLYEFYNQHLHETLDNYFDLEPILINDLPNDKYKHTFFGGVSIKIELIIEKIKKNMNNFIIFSDATIFVNQNNAHLLQEFINKYKNNDLCFADNDRIGYCNIGFILINCNLKTLSFFEGVLSDLKKYNDWDQNIVNLHLNNNNNLKVDTFDYTKILCGWDFDHEYKDTYLIFKSFIHHEPNININFNKRLEIFYKSGLIDETEYNKFKK